jgi:hypothetical protein
MRESKSTTRKAASNIQCIEVLIAKPYLSQSSTNLFWTLSVYSLENHPVKTSHDIRNSEVFRFMVYDWKRTIKKLLEVHKVPYSIVHYFAPVSIYSDDQKVDALFGNEVQIMKALDELHNSTSMFNYNAPEPVETKGM